MKLWALLAAVFGALGGAAIVAGAETFSVLTYNIAGLPEGISSSHPAANTPIIGMRIRTYGVVNVQEDFNYHAALYAADNHPYRTPTSGGAGFGDGLNTLAVFPLIDLMRVKWNNCNGTDCLTPKGFTYARVRLAEGVYVDLYNVHPNAGIAAADLAARRANVSQLARFIAAYSVGNAVIVMGDTNTRYTRVGDNIRELLQTNQLTDAWVALARGGTPPAIGDPDLVCDPAAVSNACEVVDKILYRGSAHIALAAQSYNNEHRAFLDANGEPLSDHYPHTVRFEWRQSERLRMSDQFGGPHGMPFNDLPQIAGGVAPSIASLRGGSRLDAVALQFADGRRVAHGGGGGTESALALVPGEHLVAIALTRGQRSGRTRVFSATLRTDLGRTLSAGVPTADAVTYVAPAGWQIVGFTGRSGDEIDKLGVIYAPQ